MKRDELSLTEIELELKELHEDLAELDGELNWKMLEHKNQAWTLEQGEKPAAGIGIGPGLLLLLCLTNLCHLCSTSSLSC